MNKPKNTMKVPFPSRGANEGLARMLIAAFITEADPTVVCDEGDLEWVDKDKVQDLPIWEGDKIFLDLLSRPVPFFSLKLSYEGDTLVEAVLDGKPIRGSKQP